MILLHKVYMSS